MQANGTFDLVMPNMYLATNEPEIVPIRKSDDHSIVTVSKNHTPEYIVDEKHKRKWVDTLPNLTYNKINEKDPDKMFIVFECRDNCQTILDKEHVSEMDRFIDFMAK